MKFKRRKMRLPTIIMFYNFFELGQNIDSFASATQGMDTFLLEMSMKLMFTFKNFRNVY